MNKILHFHGDGYLAVIGFSYFNELQSSALFALDGLSCSGKNIIQVHHWFRLEGSFYWYSAGYLAKQLGPHICSREPRRHLKRMKSFSGNNGNSSRFDVTL